MFVHDHTINDCSSQPQGAYDWWSLQPSGRGPVCEGLLEHLLRTWKIMKREACAMLVHQSLPSLDPPVYIGLKLEIPVRKLMCATTFRRYIQQHCVSNTE